MNTSLSEFVDLYVFPSGRRAFTLASLAQIAEAMAWTQLADHCAGSVQYEQKLCSMQRALKSQKNQHSNNGLTLLDASIDRTIGALVRLCQEAVTTLAGEPEAEAAQRILDKAFPGGTTAITLLDFFEQNLKVRGLLRLFEPRDVDSIENSHLDDGCLAHEIELLSLTRYVEILRKRSDRFNALLEDRQNTNQIVTADAVRAAFAQGQEHLLQAVAMIVGRYPLQTIEHQTARTKLLAPIKIQEAAIASYHRSRRRVRDVDPVTGTEIAEEIEADHFNENSFVSPGTNDGSSLF